MLVRVRHSQAVQTMSVTRGLLVQRTHHRLEATGVSASRRHQVSEFPPSLLPSLPPPCETFSIFPSSLSPSLSPSLLPSLSPSLSPSGKDPSQTRGYRCQCQQGASGQSIPLPPSGSLPSPLSSLPPSLPEGRTGHRPEVQVSFANSEHELSLFLLPCY